MNETKPTLEILLGEDEIFLTEAQQDLLLQVYHAMFVEKNLELAQLLVLKARHCN